MKKEAKKKLKPTTTTTTKTPTTKRRAPLNNQNGPWTRVLSGRLEDSRHKPDPLPVMKYQISPTVARYVKFELYSWYGQGGGLQYFAAVKCSGE